MSAAHSSSSGEVERHNNVCAPFPLQRVNGCTPASQCVQCTTHRSAPFLSTTSPFLLPCELHWSSLGLGCHRVSLKDAKGWLFPVGIEAKSGTERHLHSCTRLAPTGARGASVTCSEALLIFHFFLLFRFQKVCSQIKHFAQVV